MKTTIKELGDEVIISLAGRLDTATSSDVQAKITRELSQKASIGRLTLDASQLEYISSSGSCRFPSNIKKSFTCTMSSLRSMRCLT